MQQERIKRIGDHYRAICGAEGDPLPPLREGDELAEECRAALAAGEECFDEADYVEAFCLAYRSPFLQGNGKRRWKANFLWLITPSNMRKVLAGKYTPQIDEFARMEIHATARLLAE